MTKPENDSKSSFEFENYFKKFDDLVREAGSEEEWAKRNAGAMFMYLLERLPKTKNEQEMVVIQKMITALKEFMPKRMPQEKRKEKGYMSKDDVKAIHKLVEVLKKNTEDAKIKITDLHLSGLGNRMQFSSDAEIPGLSRN
jgi:uncharacterized membrane protein